VVQHCAEDRVAGWHSSSRISRVFGLEELVGWLYLCFTELGLLGGGAVAPFLFRTAPGEILVEKLTRFGEQ